MARCTHTQPKGKQQIAAAASTGKIVWKMFVQYIQVTFAWSCECDRERSSATTSWLPQLSVCTVYVIWWRHSKGDEWSARRFAVVNNAYRRSPAAERKAYYFMSLPICGQFYRWEAKRKCDMHAAPASGTIMSYKMQREAGSSSLFVYPLFPSWRAWWLNDALVKLLKASSAMCVRVCLLVFNSARLRIVCVRCGHIYM